MIAIGERVSGIGDRVSGVEPRVPVSETRHPTPDTRLRRASRFAVFGAALIILLAYLTPLWHIGLKAPQYPEGLGLYIWANRIVGEKPQDLNSINGLNHYIGMKPIEPESIPELKYMPLAIGALAASGLLVALVRSRRVFYAWTALFTVGALAGLADFWHWGYDYGHNLNPRAAIQVPGMSYQPPLLGTKQLLNFRATSWPALGGWIVILALVLAVGACFLEWRSTRSVTR